MRLYAKTLFSILAFTTIVAAQEYRATVSGRVTDPTGATVAGVAISVRSNATGAITPTTTDDEGRYTVPFLNPGQYTVTAEKTGFQKSVQEGLTLQIAERATLDISLAVGDVSQSLTVTANAGVIEVESADRGLTIDNKRVEATPLQGRNIIAMAWTTPGVAVTGGVQRLRPFDTGGSSGMAINGGRPSMNEVLIDGTSNLSKAQSVAYVPPVEATDEFKVQTTAYDAQYGWTTGGIVNILTKGGSNDFHGNLFEFLQNTHLNANTFNNNRTGVRRSSSHINTFGGSLGGAVLKNKLFFFGAYENIRQVIPDPFVTSVPTTAMRAGDFSALSQTIYDPATTRTVNGTLVRDPFPGNIIPSNRFNPIAVKTLGLIPLPNNTTGDPASGQNNFSTQGGSRKFTDYFPEYLARADYNINDSTRMFVRYSRNALSEQRGFRYSTNDNLNVADTSGNSPFTRENHSASIGITKTISPSTVLDLRFGLSRFKSQGGSSISEGFDVTSLGFSQQFASQATKYLPIMRFTNYEGAGASPSTIDPTAQTNSFQGTLYHNMGAHALKFGGEFRNIRAYANNQGNSAGSFSFTQQFTGSNPAAVNATSGNAIASFLLGTPQSGSIDVNSRPARQERLFSLFFHDDFRVTNKLKLNLGVRWDYLGPLTDRFDALTRGFNPTVTSPLVIPGYPLKGGLEYVGINGNDRGAFNKDWNNIAPRAGFAYQWNDKTVLRGGYAMMYAQVFDDPGQAPGYSQSTSMVTSVTTGVPYNTLTNPFPDGILRPVGNSQGYSTFLGQNFSFANPNRKLPYTHQFSFEIQRELPGRLLLTAGYVGSRIRNLSVSKAYNEVSLESLALGSAVLNQTVANPMAGYIPGTNLNAATTTRQQLLRPFPQFGSITETTRSEGQSSYNAFQLLLSKRLSKGLTASLSYTYSRTLELTDYRNAQDTRPEKTVAQWDVPQSLQLHGVYELPFGKGRKFLAASPAVVKQLVSGWEISGIARLQSGMPLLFGNNSTVPTGIDPSYSGQSLDRWFNTCTVLSDGSTRNCLSGESPAWSVRPANVLQTWSSRVTSVRRPGIRNLDLAVMKRTNLTENVLLTFRAEAMNATNTPQFFNGPNLDVTNLNNFGKIAGVIEQSNLPRFVQLSLKLQF